MAKTTRSRSARLPTDSRAKWQPWSIHPSIHPANRFPLTRLDSLARREGEQADDDAAETVARPVGMSLQQDDECRMRRRPGEAGGQMGMHRGALTACPIRSMPGKKHGGGF